MYKDINNTYIVNKPKPFDCDIDDIGLGTGREPHWISLAIFMKVTESSDSEILAENFCKLFSEFIEYLKQNKSAEMIDKEYTNIKLEAIKKDGCINLIYTDLSDTEIVLDNVMTEDSFSEFAQKLLTAISDCKEGGNNDYRTNNK